jgi:hypothetical protein
MTGAGNEPATKAGGGKESATRKTVTKGRPAPPVTVANAASEEEYIIDVRPTHLSIGRDLF